MLYKNKKEAALYLLPAIMLVGVFIYIAIILNGYYSLFRWSSYSPKMVWVGLQNYTRLLQDKTFWIALKNTGWFVVISVIVEVGFALVLAAIMEEKWLGRFGPFCRTVFFLPSMLSMTVVALLWMLMLNDNTGFVNDALRAIGFESLVHEWLGDGKTAMFCVIAAEQWQFLGYSVMLFIVGIQKIPTEYYESAELDGANAIQRFFYITVPNVKEMFLLNTVTTIIAGFKAFEQVYAMTGGGPGRASEVLGTMLYREAFKNDQMGYASAIGSAIFIITFVFSIMQLKMFKSDGIERGDNT